MHAIFDLSRLEHFRKQQKLDPYRIKQLRTEVFKNARVDFSEMTTFSKDLRKQFADSFTITTLTTHKTVEGKDTTKFLFRTHDGHHVEAVLMYHYHQSNNQNNQSTNTINRVTLCISTQIGCPVGCIFCVTGKLGLTRNLTMDEIMSQVLLCNHYVRQKFGKKDDGTRWNIRNIVYMGMGEPFLNYDAVIDTIPYLSDPKYMGLSNKRITISTSGVTGSIERFTQDNPPAALAFSLHAPNQQLRSELVPFAKMFPLDELMFALDNYVDQTGNEVFYEYVMIKDKNDTDDLAHQTGQLLRHRKAHLNLIAYNENPVMDLSEPSRNRIMRFKNIVEGYKVMVTIRGNMGRKSKGACGQLGREKVQKKKS